MLEEKFSPEKYPPIIECIKCHGGIAVTTEGLCEICDNERNGQFRLQEKAVLTHFPEVSAVG
jgi:hypothetical protein